MNFKTIGATAALTLIALTGCSTAAAPTPAALPAPTVTAEPVEVTPQSCLDALDYADTGFGYAAKTLGYVEDAINAILASDIGEIERITGKVTKVGNKLDDLAPKYNEAKEECRAAA